MNSSAHLTATLICVAALTFAGCKGDSNTNKQTASTATETALPAGQFQKIEIEVAGMTCEGCASSISTAVKALPGVQNCDVQVKTGQVLVEFDPQKVNLTKIAKAITSQGYKPKI